MSNVPPGWYQDPHQPGQVRWWDGSVWTDHIQTPHPPQQPNQQPYQQPYQQPNQQPYQQPYQQPNQQPKSFISRFIEVVGKPVVILSTIGICVILVVGVLLMSSSGEVYAIGDVGPGGGRIFITPSTEGNSTNLYFEAAPYVDESVGTWCSTTDTLLGASGTAIGTGATNTATAAAFCSSGAIQAASIYSNNGFSDWFLPSKDELNELYLNKELLGGFSTDYYWSSSEFDALSAWDQDFDDGYQYNGSKNYTFYVRLVRAFSPDSGSPESSTSSNSVDSTTTITTPPAATSTSDTSVSVKPGEVYAIGEVGPGGGRIFITPSTEGNSTNLYFEAAPYADESVGTWCSATDMLLGASGTAIGTGATNTATAAATCSSGAIHMASIYSNNGFSDWFLPSQDELNELYLNKEFLGGFSPDYYWSSSELDANIAWGQNFNLGNQFNYRKVNSTYVRPVRAFS